MTYFDVNQTSVICYIQLVSRFLTKWSLVTYVFCMYTVSVINMRHNG